MKWAKKLDINNVGCFSEKEVELSTVRDDTFLQLTIDTGAGENVMSEHMAPRTPVQQQAGAMYTAANGEIMPNLGKKVLKQTKTMTMQVTDVNKALLSVSRICDHTVVFKPEGGVIRNSKTGDETKFRCENNVYRMDDRQAPRGGFCEAVLSRDGGRESEVLRKPVRPRELEVAGSKTRTSRRSRMKKRRARRRNHQKSSETRERILPARSRSTTSHTYLSDLGALIVLLGRLKIVLTRRGKIRARSRSPRSCSTTASWAVRMRQRHWLC